MAVTTKFNEIAVEFTTRIGDPCSVSANVITPSKNLTKAEIESYVNRALDKLFTDQWLAAKGDEWEFLRTFPELLKTIVNGNIVGGLSTSYGNHFKLVHCMVNDIPARIWDIGVYDIAKSGTMFQYESSATKPAVIDKNGTLEFFGITSSTNLDIGYIIKPLKTDGSFFVSSADGEDEPFSKIWNNTIAEIAEQLYRNDAQENS